MAWISRNSYLTQAEMENNALLVRDYFYQVSTPWTDNAIAGVLGNMQTESTINPGLWQVGYPQYGPYTGYGLVQWTPYSTLADYLSNWQDNGDGQCGQINNELQLSTPVQWIPAHGYTLTGMQFTQSTLPPDDLAEMFLYCYERPADPASTAALRRSQALDWYTYITGHPYQRRLPLWLLWKMSNNWRC